LIAVTDRTLARSRWRVRVGLARVLGGSPVTPLTNLSSAHELNPGLDLSSGLAVGHAQKAQRLVACENAVAGAVFDGKGGVAEREGKSWPGRNEDGRSSGGAHSSTVRSETT
jgi:hypothetical protein